MSRTLRAILWGGLAVGVLDAFDAMAAWGVLGVPPMRVWQGVAAGLLGRESFQGGARTAALGLAIHFFIAFVVAAVYVMASFRLPVLRGRAVACGLLYGVAVHFFMSYVVIPLSAIGGGGRFRWFLFLNGVIGHALLVGLPVALISRRFLGTR